MKFFAIPAAKENYMVPITALIAILLAVVSSYTFIYILLETATVCGLARLVYAGRSAEELPKESCAPLPNLAS